MSVATSFVRAARHLPTLFLAAIVAGAAGAAETARMQLPQELAASAERHAISGIGGRNRGEYRLGSGGGSFVRIESRFAVLDPLFEANRGRSSFTLAGQEFSTTLAGECSFKENVVNVGVLTFDAKKLAYVCTISSGNGAFDGSLTLGEPKPRNMRERVLAQAIRVGSADVGSIRVGIESVHRFEGSRIVSDVPVGYTLSLDDRIVGAVELTDVNPTIILASGVEVAERHAVLAAALGVAVLRDPANSALGD